MRPIHWAPEDAMIDEDDGDNDDDTDDDDDDDDDVLTLAHFPDI